MSDTRIDLYEGMFLLPQAASSDLEASAQIIRDMLERAQAETVSLRKWDERRLAYPIKGQKRGVYFLAYFRAPRNLIANIERDVNLSEDVLRCLILRAEHVGEVELQTTIESQETFKTEQALRSEKAETSSAPADKPEEAAAEKAEPVASAAGDSDDAQAKAE